MRPGRTLAMALAALALGAPGAAQARDATVTSFDGTPINTHFFPAAGPGAGKRAPTVLVGHGYGMMGETNPDSASGGIFGQVGLGPLRRAGYNVLTWDARGFGRSGGQVQVDSAQFEGRDVQALIDFVARQPEAQLDAPGDPRLGMNGVSYGGGIQLITAGLDRRVDAITPTIAWNSLVTSLYKEQVVKQGWGTLLGAAGGTRVNPQITTALTEGLASGRLSKASVDFFASRGLPDMVSKVRVPTLLIQGTADTLFTLDEARRNHATLRGNGVPVRMVWFCGGHGLCTTGQGPADLVETSVLRWFGRYLDRDPKVNPGAAFSWVDQQGAVREGATYPPRENGVMSAGGSGTLAIAPGPGNGAAIAASPDPAAYSLDIPGPDRAFDVAGSPTVSMTYSGNGGSTHVYAQVVNPARNVVLGNVAQPVPVTLDGRRHTVVLPIEAIAFHGTPGAKLRLQIAPASSLYATQRSAGLLTLERVGVSVPTVNLSAKPALAVKIGATRGLAKARRGRNAFVRVRGAGDRLSNVRVVLRDRRGRLVGRTAVFSLGPASRRVRLRVFRRLPAGRYRLRATALSPERIDVRGDRRVRLERR